MSKTLFAALLAAAAMPGVARAETQDIYVALGSSFAAGPGLGPKVTDSPGPCDRGTNSYPRTLAAQAGLALHDASCSGATVAQVLGGGQAGLPPQVAAITPDTWMVTITAGGNDVGYIGDMMRIAHDGQTAPPRTAAQRPFDTLRTTMLALFHDIRRRAPAARIVVTTYPLVLPPEGTCPALHLTADQTAIFREVAAQVAAVTRETADQGGAAVVDMAQLSIGHDACSSTPWTNGARPAAGVPFHPTMAGALATSQAIAHLIGRPAPAPTTPSPDSFANPLLPSGPDPWVAMKDGVYYYTSTSRDGIVLRRTRDITDLAHAESRKVWTPPETGPNAHLIWAPELHFLRGKWYLYYTATASGFGDDSHRGIFVLEHDASDPLQGPWIDRGRLNTQHAGIDGTVFDHGGQLYFAYSPYLGPVSGIALARLDNPWTIGSPETIIARPDRPWEDRGGRKILEGPEFLEGPGGQVFMTYSAGACWSDGYALGLLRAARGSNLLSASSWTKSDTPALHSGNGVFATGHNGFFRSPDGREQWIVYHANPGPGMGCTPRRAPYLGRVSWSAEGIPVIARPSAPGSLQRKPSGTAAQR
jgi:GH43 family beta-xylosidase/lysophospholipase L1-like esterase